MNRAINIFDQDGNKFGELPDATNTQILGLIEKNLIVKDVKTGEQLTQEAISAEISVSDGAIILG